MFDSASVARPAAEVHGPACHAPTAERRIEHGTAGHGACEGLDMLHSTAIVRDGKIAEYHVNVKVAFVVEGGVVQA
jgi:hypothetical protein